MLRFLSDHKAIPGGAGWMNAAMEIVGARIGDVITNNPRIIADAVERNAVTEFLDRDRMRFMAAMDLGRNWVVMAEGPTLFCIDKNGKIVEKGMP
jgi:hypothetical protein